MPKRNHKILRYFTDIDQYIIRIHQTMRDAINAFGSNKGLPLIVINDSNELVGALSNGDIRRFLATENKKLSDNLYTAVNKNPQYCFEDDDKSICEHILSTEKTRIVPIVNLEKVVVNMSLADLQAYVCEDYFFRFDQDSEEFEEQVKKLGLDKESEVE